MRLTALALTLVLLTLILLTLVLIVVVKRYECWGLTLLVWLL